MFVRSGCEAGSAQVPEESTNTLIDWGAASERQMSYVLDDEKRRGNLPSDTNTQELAQFLISTMHGLSVQARLGKSGKELQSAVDLTVRVLVGVN